MSSQNLPPDFQRQSYVFELPQERIAQFPAKERQASRLLVIDRAKKTLTHTSFSAIANYLPKNAILVANNSKVVPARLCGTRETGGKFEFLLLTPLPLLEKSPIDQAGFAHCVCLGLVRQGGRVVPGQELKISEDLKITILELGSFGKHRCKLSFRGDLETLFTRFGKVPLPPYIKREPDTVDLTRYQTVYAKEPGSVAAPTAGLHFTKELQASLVALGFTWLELTLFVGYGTFSPVRSNDIREHTMHSEYIEISADVAQTITLAKAQGRPIIAIGTTSVRALEGAYKACGRLEAFAGWTDIFLYPGKKVQVIDGLVTNFHLPGSSLILLVASLVGRQRLLEIYQEAIAKQYNFFSYGDAMLIL